MPERGAGLYRRGEGAERRAVFRGAGRGRSRPRRVRPRQGRLVRAYARLARRLRRLERSRRKSSRGLHGRAHWRSRPGRPVLLRGHESLRWRLLQCAHPEVQRPVPDRRVRRLAHRGRAVRSPRALRAGAGVFLCHRHRLRGPLRRGWPLPLPGWALLRQHAHLQGDEDERLLQRVLRVRAGVRVQRLPRFVRAVRRPGRQLRRHGRVRNGVLLRLRHREMRRPARGRAAMYAHPRGHDHTAPVRGELVRCGRDENLPAEKGRRRALHVAVHLPALHLRRPVRGVLRHVNANLRRRRAGPRLRVAALAAADPRGVVGAIPLWDSRWIWSRRQACPARTGGCRAGPRSGSVSRLVRKARGGGRKSTRTAFIRHRYEVRLTLPHGCHEPAGWGGTERHEAGDGGIKLPWSVQPDAREIRVSQRVSRIRSASLRFPPPPPICSSYVR